jgi:NAD(P)H-nitrite reductase large subunit
MADDKKLTLEEIKAKIQVVCICKGVKMGRMCEAIAKGAQTVAQVHKATNSGDGGCGATRCTPVIEALLKNGGRPLPKIRKEPEQDLDPDFDEI